MRAIEAWRLRGRTAHAMALLCVAQLMVQLVPFRYWRAALGQLSPGDSSPAAGVATEWAAGTGCPARRLAVHVERGAERLPFATCLPQAMALCWMLRGARIAYILKIAARPAAVRRAMPISAPDGPEGNPSRDILHAWVESGGSTVIGALPGPWLVVLALRGCASG